MPRAASECIHRAVEPGIEPSRRLRGLRHRPRRTQQPYFFPGANNAVPNLRATLLVAVALLAGCASTPPATQTARAEPAVSPAIVKPAIDARAYRAITLPNGLHAVLISDPNADKSAASLVVHRGSFDEPLARPGLAHFLEHMLFLGTAKYPIPDEYAAFINSHGGSNNAYTAGDHTNFFFEVAPEQFAEALDRFAQFFIAPTFDAQYVDKEMNAVNSEYQMQIKQDEWRDDAVQKLALNPAHPASRFTIGSLATLASKPDDNIRDDLVAYFNTAYAPANMTLAVYGREDLDTLERLVSGLFATVPPRAASTRATPPPIYLPGALPRWLDIQPVRDERIVSFSFPLPGQDALYREKPAEYLANLIGHEGVGSLHSALKRNGWIESLAAGAGRVDSANAEFSVEIRLTESGAQHVPEIGAALFSYLELLRGEGILERLYAEQATIAKLGFDYQEQGKAIGYVIGVAVNMEFYPVQDVLRAPAAFDRFDAALIRQTLGALNVDNVLVTYVSPDIKPTGTEPWFNVPYANRPLPAALGAAWRTPAAQPGIALPAPNPFLPERLTLVEGGATPGAPRSLAVDLRSTTAAADAPGLRLWHLPDTEFRAPRADVVVRLATPLVRNSAAAAAYASLYVQLVRDALDSYSYPAALAGLNYDIRTSDKGLILMLGGFNDKEPVLLETVLKALRDTPIDPAKFALYRAQSMREWQNTHQGRPYEQATAELPLVLLRPRWSPDALRAAAARATVPGLTAWRAAAFARVRVDLLAHGNVDAEQATRLAKVVSGYVHLCGPCIAADPDLRRVEAPLARKLDIAHDDASLVLYAQGDSRAYQERARFGLLAHLIRDPYFNALRTEQQLGYVVSVSPAVFERVPGITFVVQSNVAGPARINAATFAFLAQWRAALVAMSDADYTAQRAGLISRLLEKDRNLSSRSARLWTDLDDGVTTFDSRQQIAVAVATLTKADLLSFYDRLLTRLQTRRLTVLSEGKFGAAPLATFGADSTKAPWQAFEAAGATGNAQPASSMVR